MGDMPELMAGLFFTTELRPYRYGLVVSIGQTDAELKADLRKADRHFKCKRTAEIMAEAVLSKTWPGWVLNFEADSFMRMRELPSTIEQRGVMVHELLHVVRACMKSRNMRMSGRTGQEAYCYLLEELYIEFCHRITQHTKR
mgnify:FL=1